MSAKRRPLAPHRPRPRSRAVFPAVTVVAGPPGSGKTTYVADRSEPGDLVVDLDAVRLALGAAHAHDDDPALYRFACEARDAVLGKLAANPAGLRRAWIIRCAPGRLERMDLRNRFAATVVVLETPPAECLRRYRLDDTRPQSPAVVAEWSELVDEWWRSYEPAAEDTVERPGDGWR